MIGTYNINGLVLTFNWYYWLCYQKITFNGQKLKNMRWLVYKNFVWNLIVQSSIFIKLKCSTLPKACVLKITIEFTSIYIFLLLHVSPKFRKPAYFSWRYIIHLLHDGKGDMKLYSLKNNHISRGQRLREIWFFLGNKSSYPAIADRLDLNLDN